VINDQDEKDPADWVAKVQDFGKKAKDKFK